MTGPDTTTDLSMAEFLGVDAPSNWGRWGADDEVGALNHLDAAEVLRGIAAIRRGELFTLQAVMGHPHSDMEFPGREEINREMIYDQDSYAPGGDGPPIQGRNPLFGRPRDDLPAGIEAVRRAGARLV